MQTNIETVAGGVQPTAGASVELSGVAKAFRARGRSVQALDGIDLRAEAGEVLAVVGPSGCGKSTLLELAAGILEPDRGAVRVGGRLGGGELCAYMPQRDLLLPWRTALDNAALALECRGVGRREARRRARPLLERFGLEGFLGARPSELSGGMRQRVAFLRTLLAERPVLLLDEPFAALDAITRASMQEWLAEALRAEPRTVVLVTHDVEEALFLAGRVLVLSQRPGRVVEELRMDVPRGRSRRETVCDPAFLALRERALEALPW